MTHPPKTVQDGKSTANPVKGFAAVEVSSEASGARLDKAVRNLFHVTWNAARSWIENGKVFIDGAVQTDISFPVVSGQWISMREDAPRPGKEGELSRDQIVYIDAHVVVVEKPTGMLSVPFEEGDRGTLDQQVRSLLARILPKAARRRGPLPSLMVVHRLDRGTSGLLVFARTWLAKEGLAEQFKEHTVKRKYLALVHGLPISKTIRSHLLLDRGDGIRGSSESSSNAGIRRQSRGKLAVTHVQVIERLRNSALIALQLETGRTNQIRIHMSEDGHPLIGETVYLRKFKNAPIESPRLMLHAAELGFIHPHTGEPLSFESPLPPAFAEMIEKLR